MPTFVRDDTTIIYYEERGDGFPLLLLAPGGMRSTVEFWQHAALNPWVSYEAAFRMVAMDQRNAGSSRGPLDAGDPWGAYADDQLALLDHLGIDRFLVLGCCIGGSFILKLAERAPERVVAAVLEQPIGVTGDNAHLFKGLQTSWADELVAARDDLTRPDVDAFLAAMWRDDFVVSVDRDAIAGCPVPMLVLPGIDDFHPGDAGREVARLAPHADLIDPWKDSPELIASATEQTREWLLAHVPA
ncbi:MAG TPA: alpha/beta hydrolase [Acidimicrobiales bacterium]|jgi:pimeloyl-ACP methyl ester carboxylesterase|nr:alpha/beta hydrolase [Acidimicrobiales bacterium]